MAGNYQIPAVPALSCFVLLVPQCWERILLSLSFGEGRCSGILCSVPLLLILFKYFILVCVVGFFGSQSFHSCFLPTAAGLFVKSHRVSGQDNVFWEVAV